MTLKYENFYSHAYETGSEARSGTGIQISACNAERGYSSLDDYAPDEIDSGIHLLDRPDSRKGKIKKAG